MTFVITERRFVRAKVDDDDDWRDIIVAFRSFRRYGRPRLESDFLFLFLSILI